MSKHLETLRSVMLFATVLLLIIVLYRRLLFVMGKRKSMTATSDIQVRLEGDVQHREVVFQCKKAEEVKITLHTSDHAEVAVVYAGPMQEGTTRTPLPALAGDKTYCKVQCSREEFNLYF